MSRAEVSNINLSYMVWVKRLAQFFYISLCSLHHGRALNSTQLWLLHQTTQTCPVALVPAYCVYASRLTLEVVSLYFTTGTLTSAGMARVLRVR